MRTLIAFVIMVTLLSACGNKPTAADETLTPEQENLLVDSIGQNLQNSTDELVQTTDSLTSEVDSLLQGI